MLLFVFQINSHHACPLWGQTRSWIFRESLPPVLRLGTVKAMSKALATRTHMAFKQGVVSKFMVLHNEDIDQDTKLALLTYAREHWNDLMVLTVDMRVEPHASAIGMTILKMADVPEEAVAGKMERPLAVMVSNEATLVYDGLYQTEPMEWFWNDWAEQGSGGALGRWVDETKPKKKRKKKRKKAAKEL